MSLKKMRMRRKKRVFVEYDMAVTWWEEIRDKRRKALDAELRKLLELVETGCAAFDARLEVSLLLLFKVPW